MIQDRHAAIAWWQDLQPKPPEQAGDRATLARLRRCATVNELMMEPASIVLFRRCRATTPADLPPIALAAGVLAHVRNEEKSVHPARSVGPETPDKPETALLKPLRFRSLMEAQSVDERLTVFRRLTALANRTLNIREMIDALLDWTDDRRRRWVFEYWNADPRLHTPTSTASAKDQAA